ncbi:MAG: U32 family peptidase, partial [Lachnospiraceae bacterium]|nr:U32 family peptidase [Lachnospiraceae bacterium]
MQSEIDKKFPKSMSHTELLAPAGSFDCFRAAMKAGADAVYLGLDRYSARAGAVNFTHETLDEALDIAHILGRKIYLTVNTLFKDHEMADLYDLLYEPYINGLDGVIVQDIGVMYLISRLFPDLPIHVSTQTAVTSAKAMMLLQDLNIDRLVPARELSLDEIITLKEETGLDIECFIHGSMCYSYSGKCLLSSFIGGRSGNRGRCAQPCRLPYEGDHLLSLRDMCTIDILPRLIDAGIRSFKIEGRMKSSDYVYAVTSIYRKYIDIYEKGLPYSVSEKDRDDLISVYTRSGNCEGFYHCHNDRAMITLSSPSYQTGDGDNISGDGLRDLPRISTRIGCTIKKNEPVSIWADTNRCRIEAISDIIPEPAVNCALTKDEVVRQLKKSGNTLFDVTSVKVWLDEGLFLTKGALNRVRRQALDLLEEKMTGRQKRSCTAKAEDIVKYDLNTWETKDTAASEIPPVIAGVTDNAQLKELCALDLTDMLVSMDLFEGFFVKEGCTMPGRKIYIRLPYVIREEALSNSSKRIERFIKKYSDRPDIGGYYVSNLEGAGILEACGYKGPIIGDIHLYAYNRYAYGLLKERGITFTTVPVELNEKELIGRGIQGEELIVYGRLP